MDDVEDILKALADKNRLRIMAMLFKHKRCVCELAYVLKISQPSVSKHLKKLKQVGLIVSEQDGFWTNYYLAQSPNKSVDFVLSAVLKILRKIPQVKSDDNVIRKTDRQKLCCR